MKNTFKVLTLGLALGAFSAFAAGETPVTTTDSTKTDSKVTVPGKAPGSEKVVKEKSSESKTKTTAKKSRKKKAAPATDKPAS